MSAVSAQGRLSATVSRKRAAFEWAQRNGLFFALVILITVFAVANPRFLSRGNLTVILLQLAVVGIIAVPGAMLVLTGKVDLSVGSIMVMTSITFGALMANGAGLGWSLAGAMGLAAVWGTVTGFSVAYVGMSPIIVTLGGLAGARGVAQLISGGETQFGFGEAFRWLGNGKWLDTPIPVWLLLAAFVIGAIIWHAQPLGRHMMAIGADQTSAAAMGVSVKRIPFVLYIASAMAAGLGGLIVTSQLDGASLSIGQGMELNVLTAILLGGVSFTGGRGSLFGVLFGTLFIGVLSNGLILVNVSPFWKEAVVGAALFLAAALDVVYQRLDRVTQSEDSEEVES
jgi:ribose transport system permease protein